MRTMQNFLLLAILSQGLLTLNSDSITHPILGFDQIMFPIFTSLIYVSLLVIL